MAKRYPYRMTTEFGSFKTKVRSPGWYLLHPDAEVLTYWDGHRMLHEAQLSDQVVQGQHFPLFDPNDLTRPSSWD